MKAHEKIRQVRLEKKFSQKEIAKKLSIEQATYSNWESGKTDLTLSMLDRLGFIYGMTALEILTYQDVISDSDMKRQFDLQKSLAEAYSENAAMYKAHYERLLKENERLIEELAKLKNGEGGTAYISTAKTESKTMKKAE